MPTTEDQVDSDRRIICKGVGERTVGQLSREELEAASRRSIEALDGIPGIVWVRSYVSEASGKVYCEYEAPDEASIREHARRAGLPVDQVSEVTLEISPAMFR